MSENRRFRGERGPQMMKGGFGRMLPPQLAKLLTEGQRQEIRQAVENLHQHHRQQIKATIQEFIKGCGVELPSPEQKKQPADK